MRKQRRGKWKGNGKPMDGTKRKFELSELIYPLFAVGTFAAGAISGNAFLQDTLIMIFFWAATAGAWNIIGGYGGQFALGHSAFLGIGAYTSTILYAQSGMSPWLGLICGGIIAALVATFLGVVTIRLKGPYFALGTLAIGQVLHIVAVNWKSLTNSSEGIYVKFEPSLLNFLFEGKIPYLLVCILMTSLVFYISKLIEVTRIGYYLAAMKEDEDAARSLGVPPVKVRVFAFAMSAFLTAILGTFYAQYIQFIEPASVLSLHFSVQMALITIIGGVGIAYGPLVGSIIIVPLSLFLRAWLGGKYGAVHMAIYGAVLVFVVISMQQGVAPAIRDRLFPKRLKME
jgi:branched-chain amino acid transport system permease protein